MDAELDKREARKKTFFEPYYPVVLWIFMYVWRG